MHCSIPCLMFKVRSGIFPKFVSCVGEGLKANIGGVKKSLCRVLQGFCRFLIVKDLSWGCVLKIFFRVRQTVWIRYFTENHKSTHLIYLLIKHIDHAVYITFYRGQFVRKVKFGLQTYHCNETQFTYKRCIK